MSPIRCPFISRKRCLSNNELFHRDSLRLSFNKTVYQLNTIFSLPLSPQTHREVKTNRTREKGGQVETRVLERHGGGRVAVEGWFGGAVPRTGNALCPWCKNTNSAAPYIIAAWLIKRLFRIIICSFVRIYSALVSFFLINRTINFTFAFIKKYMCEIKKNCTPRNRLIEKSSSSIKL